MTRPVARAVLGALLAVAAAYPQALITTIAGTDWFFPDNGKAATAAALGFVATVAIDRQGNLYVADAGNEMVFRISRDGVVRVVAGNGITGDFGDGGPATEAALSSPRGLAFDRDGNLYIADSSYRVRRVGRDGKITTVAGSGERGFSGDGGPAVRASLAEPEGIAFDSQGNLYIADGFNHRVRRVSPDGVITTIAGNGQRAFSGDGGPAREASLAGPKGLGFDAAGNLYIADAENDRIRRVDANGNIATVAGGGEEVAESGMIAAAALTAPHAVAFDSAGNLYIADAYRDRILRVAQDGTYVVFAGRPDTGFSGDGGPATQATLNLPVGLAIDAEGAVHIADMYNYRVRRVFDGTITTIAGNGRAGFYGDDGPANLAQLNTPFGLAIDPSGNLYVADLGNNRVRKISPSGQITTVAGTGEKGSQGDGRQALAAQLSAPRNVAADAGGNLYISEFEGHRVRKVTPDGRITTHAGTGVAGYGGDGGPAVIAQLAFPAGLALDVGGNLYIADSSNRLIRRVSPAGVILTGFKTISLSLTVTSK